MTNEILLTGFFVMKEKIFKGEIRKKWRLQKFKKGTLKKLNS